jgi:hypothetical protein
VEISQNRILDLALETPELSPRELALPVTDTERDLVSEASVYRLLKAHDLITSPALVGAMLIAPGFEPCSETGTARWRD